MTAGAIVGVCIVRYSPLPLLANISLAFAFSSLCLMISRTTLIPLISACMLPVLLKTESWVYPAAVFIMSGIIIYGQKLMEQKEIRKEIAFTPQEINWKQDSLKWLVLLISLVFITAIPVYTLYIYCILPPLIVTYVEFARSKAGFRNRPVQILLLLISSATIGASFQWFIHCYLGLPESVVACLAFICLFCIFEWMGKFFAPAGAIALIPMIIPKEDLLWFPLQVTIGATVFISVAMLLFLQCYKWSKAQLIYSLTPSFILNRRK